MKKTTVLTAALALLAAGFFAGCETLEGHEGAVIGSAAGAAGGALIGSAAAGSGNRGTGAVIGGALGGVAGGVAGDQFYDEKKKDGK